jgi:hypothetical protein
MDALTLLHPLPQLRPCTGAVSLGELSQLAKLTVKAGLELGQRSSGRLLGLWYSGFLVMQLLSRNTRGPVSEAWTLREEPREQGSKR